MCCRSPEMIERLVAAPATRRSLREESWILAAAPAARHPEERLTSRSGRPGGGRATSSRRSGDPYDEGSAPPRRSGEPRPGGRRRLRRDGNLLRDTARACKREFACCP